MAERLQRSYDLPCSADALLAALAQPDVVRRRSEADGLGDARRQARGLRRRGADRRLHGHPLDWLPSAITSRLGGSPTVERMEEWMRYRTGCGHR